jgi:hypothetical protein
MLRLRIRERGARFTIFDIDPGDRKILGRRNAQVGDAAWPKPAASEGS